MKTCKRCGGEYPKSNFYAADKTCKICRRYLVRTHRIENIEKVLEYDRNRPNQDERDEQNKRNYQKRIATPEGRAREWARAKKYRSGDKRAANLMVQNAVKRGDLTKQPCEECGGVERIHAHHEDYTKPMEVNWLCATHHGARHRELNEEKRNGEI